MTRNRFWLLLCCLMLNACRSLPNLDDRETSLYIPTQSAPRLEQALNLPAATSEASAPQPPETEPDDDQNTVYPNTAYPADVQLLNGARSAYHARAVLLDNAAVSIDAQYYIWRDDISGLALLQKLWQAAERGVRVRLLLDDNNTHGMDAILSALNSHPNIQIRLFNPFLYRKWRFIGYLTDFSRLNRRMHNKALIADNRVSIIGGRNIGDEYFDIHREQTFADTDVMVSGAIVPQISQDFDRYWQSHSAYPLERIVRRADIAAGLERLKSSLHPSAADSADGDASALRLIPHIRAATELISDDPAKALNRRTRVDIAESMQAALGEPKREIYLVSPYFVPTRTGIQVFRQLGGQGVRTTVFTNSLNATDVAAVHSGYTRYRRALLHAGVQLYEFKGDTAVKGLRDRGLTGSSITSLHAKTFIIDQERVFIGSFNLDPRSARLNTEMGLVIHSPALAQLMQGELQRTAESGAYHVRLDPQGRMQWYDPQTQSSSPKEPDAPLWKRLLSKIFSWLPIERLL